MSALPLHTAPADLPAQQPLADAVSAAAAEPASPRPILAPTRRSPIPLSGLWQTKLGAEAEADAEPAVRARVPAARAPEPAPPPVERRPAPRPEPAAPEDRTPEKAAPATRIGYAVQLVTLDSDNGAAAASRKWSRKGYETYLYPVVSAKGNVQFTVRTGIYPNHEQAAAKAAAIRRKKQIFAVPVPVALDETGQPAPVLAPNMR